MDQSCALVTSLTYYVVSKEKTNSMSESTNVGVVPS